MMKIWHIMLLLAVLWVGLFSLIYGAISSIDWADAANGVGAAIGEVQNGIDNAREES